MSLKRVCYSGSIHFPLSVLRRENISKCHLHVWSTGCISGIVTFQNSFTIFLKERTDERTLRCFSCRPFAHSPRLHLQSERSQRAVSVFFFWVTVDCEHARGAGGEARETTGGTHTLYKPAHYATSRTQHCWLTTPNIVGCYIHVAFVSTPCCMLLRVVVKSLKPATTCKRTQQHPTMLGVVGQQCCLRLQGL